MAKQESLKRFIDDKKPERKRRIDPYYGPGGFLDRRNEVMAKVRAVFGSTPPIGMHHIGEERHKPKTRLGDFAKYEIPLGFEQTWNYEPFLEQSATDYIELRRYGAKTRFSLPFSCERDDNLSFESEHCFLSGRTGMGKTNLCALLAVGFPRRPNPTVTLWISQKPMTMVTDVPKVIAALAKRKRKSVKITVGEKSSEGCLPLEALQLEDIKQWLKMSNEDFRAFQNVIYAYRQQGQSTIDALRYFITEVERGKKYSGQVEGMIASNIFATKRRDQLEFKPHCSYFLDISKLVNTESNAVIDGVINGWLMFLYEFISKKRKEAALQFKSDPNYYKKQYQGLIIFDEFYDLYQNKKLDRTKNTISTIATGGRQEGTSLVMAAQTVYASRKEKVPISQASYLIQFRYSSKSDKDFAMRTMGWEGNQYTNQVEEILTKTYPYNPDKRTYRGKVLLFSRAGIPIRQLDLDLFESSTYTEPEQSELSEDDTPV